VEDRKTAPERLEERGEQIEWERCSSAANTGYSDGDSAVYYIGYSVGNSIGIVCLFEPVLSGSR